MGKSIEHTSCSTVAFWLEQKFWMKIKIQLNKSHYEQFYVFGNRISNIECENMKNGFCGIIIKLFNIEQFTFGTDGFSTYNYHLLLHDI